MGSRRRKRSLSTPPAWAFPSAGEAHKIEGIGWDVAGSAAVIAESIPAGAGRVSADKEADGDTSPRMLVTKTLTSLQNQKSRMNYPEYRQLGLPITSAHMESTVKQINRRIKGSEKFWSNSGSESLLQLVADEISDTQPMDEFWRKRSQTQPGYRTYAKHAI